MGTIRDRTARRIACEWHGGQWSPLYALCSTGEIRHNAVCSEIINGCEPADRRERDRLDRLRAYVDRHGNRGPVEGWSKMPW